MDKNWKLQRYDRKDYTELVEFPVEIVGRDGVVRRYTFEDSIRLYQRRITFAPIRYRDVDLVRAEVAHCRSRIDQLRRSYYHRFGWGTPEGEPDAEEIFGELAGELAAFLCRVLRCSGRPEIRFQPVQPEQDGSSVWYITPLAAQGGMLLYFHRFEGSGADGVRERFFAFLKDLELVGRSEGDSEQLLAFHHTVDCGFVLTGRGTEFAHLSSGQEPQDSLVDLAPTPWDEVMEVIRRGDYESALRRCRKLVQEQPWHRNAYVSGGMLGTFLGENAVAEELALLGSRYFPEDGVLRYYLGVARMNLGRLPEAEADLREATRLAPDLVAARMLLVVLLIQGRRLREATAILAARTGIKPDDRRANADLDRLEKWLRWRNWVLGAGALLLLVGGVGAVQYGVVGLLPFVLGCSVLLGGWVGFHRQLDALLTQHRFEEISQGLRRLHRYEQGVTPVS